MYSIYNLEVAELNESFVESIKKQYAGKHIEITITSLENDETTLLLSEPENKKRLLKSITNVKKRKNLVEVSWDDL